MREESRGLSADTVSFALGDVLFSYSNAGGVDSWLRLCDEVRGLVHSIMTARGGVPAGHLRSKLEFAYAFSRASVAIEAMVEVLRACSAGIEINMAGPSIRAAVFSGEIDSGQASYAGLPLEHAAALKDLAYANQLLVSLSARELARVNTPNSIQFRDMGVHRVDESTPPQRLFQVIAEDIPEFFPPIRSVESPFTNIVPTSTSFIARERELFEMAMRLRSSRLLTICGPAGVGKSRSAIQLARLLTYEYLDGAFRIDLGELAQPSFIIETIVAQLSFIDISGGDLRGALLRQLGRKQILLIFDNCDALQEPLAAEVEKLIADLGRVEIIVTAREPLGVAHEAVYSLPPLDDPATRSGLLDGSQSFSLLLDRIGQVLPGYVATENDERDLLKICRRLRGMPLAIELVASKFRSLSAREVLAQVESITEDTLSSRPRDLQVLIDRILEWVYESLPPTEKLVFRRLSAFVDGWQAEALSYVCSDQGFSEKEIKQAAEMLGYRGLVSRVDLGADGHRDRLAQALWQFSDRKSAAAGEEGLNHKRHLDWFSKTADETAEAMIGRHPAQVVARIDRETANIRAAIEYALGSGQEFDAAYRLVLGFQMFWYRRGLFTEGRVWLTRLLETTPYESSLRRAQALNILGVFFNAAGEESEALKYLAHGLAIAEKLDLRLLAAMIRQNMSISYRGLQDSPRASALLREVVKTLDTLGEKRRYAVCLSALGGCLTEMGELEEAMAVTERALQLHQEFGNEWLVVVSNFNLAEIAIRQGQVEKAEPLLTQSLTQYHEQRDLRGVATTLKSMAVVADRLGQPERAAVLLGAASSVRNRLHQELPAIEEVNHEALIERISESLGNATFFKRWTEGTSLSADGAVSFATGSDSPSSRS